MDKIVFYRNAEVFYSVYGKGQPLLLLHGFGEDGQVWNSQVKFLKEYFLVIVPDLPGSGKSSQLKNETISLESLADCIQHILVTEGIENCMFIGHSMGGYIALTFLKKYPKYLKALGLVHSTSFADSDEKIITRKKAIEFIKEQGSGSFLKTSIPNLFSEKSKVEKTKEIKDLCFKGAHFSQEVLIQYYHAMINRKDSSSELSKSTIPILFVAGKEDAAVPLADVLKQVHLPAISFIHILGNVGHMSMIEQPDELATIILQFCLTVWQTD